VLGYALSPVGRVFSSTGSGVGGFFHTAGQVSSLAEDNARLSRQVAELRQRLSDDAELRVQNDVLRRQLNFGSTRADQLVPAQVVAYQPDNFRQYLTINRGSSDGLKEGMAVVSEGFLVGKIAEVGPKTAKVFLVIDPTFRVNGLSQETRATGTVHGQIGSGLTMEKIAQSDTIHPGDTIITSGLGGDLPRGLMIGHVESVSSSDNAVFQSAQVASDLKFAKLEIVFVVVNPS
jgi:rod shape-determining protein MreC